MKTIISKNIILKAIDLSEKRLENDYNSDVNFYIESEMKFSLFRKNPFPAKTKEEAISRLKEEDEFGLNRFSKLRLEYSGFFNYLKTIKNLCYLTKELYIEVDSNNNYDSKLLNYYFKITYNDSDVNLLNYHLEKS